MKKNLINKNNNKPSFMQVIIKKNIQVRTLKMIAEHIFDNLEHEKYYSVGSNYSTPAAEKALV